MFPHWHSNKRYKKSYLELLMEKETGTQVSISVVLNWSHLQRCYRGASWELPSSDFLLCSRISVLIMFDFNSFQENARLENAK